MKKKTASPKKVPLADCAEIWADIKRKLHHHIRVLPDYPDPPAPSTLSTASDRSDPSDRSNPPASPPRPEGDARPERDARPDWDARPERDANPETLKTAITVIRALECASRTVKRMQDALLAQERACERATRERAAATANSKDEETASSEEQARQIWQDTIAAARKAREYRRILRAHEREARLPARNTCPSPLPNPCPPGASLPSNLPSPFGAPGPSLPSHPSGSFALSDLSDESAPSPPPCA